MFSKELNDVTFFKSPGIFSQCAWGMGWLGWLGATIDCFCFRSSCRSCCCCCCWCRSVAVVVLL